MSDQTLMRLQRLEDHLAIQQLAARFSDAVNERDVDAFISTWAYEIGSDGMKLFLAAACIGVIAAPAHAQQNCGDLTDQTLMNVCAQKAFEKADGELNKLYRQTETRLKDDADTTKLLVTAQRAWVAFRDSECRFSSSMVAQGTVYPFVQNSCLEGLTQNRIKDLTGYLTCEEGDMSCPVPAK